MIILILYMMIEICSIGKKLSDNDLIGTLQIIIGKRDLAARYGRN